MMRCREQVQAAGPVALLLEAPVPDFAQPVEEEGPGQRVAGFAFVEPDLYTTAPVGVNEIAQRLNISKVTLYKYLRHRKVVIHAHRKTAAAKATN